MSTQRARSTIAEPSRQLPVFGEYDLVVLGAGPSGIAASVSAARRGARTLLVERYGFAGGMGTAGGVTNFAGLYGRIGGEMVQVVRGVVDELLERIDRLDGLNVPQLGLQGRIQVRSYDVSAYKCAADELLLAAGVEPLFHAQAAAVVGTPERIDALVIETRSGRQALRARCFVDCSGDGELAAFAGVPCDKGDGQGGALFPTTMFRVGGVDAERALAAIGTFGAIDALMDQAASDGRYRFPRRGAIVRPQKDPTQWRVNVTQIRNAAGLAMDATDARQLAAGEVEGRRQVREYHAFLCAEVPGFERCQILEIAPQVGVRETRRMRGRYALSGEDVVACARFEDAIGVNAWPMEMHVAGEVRWQFHRDQSAAYNQLPWRMLVPAEGPRNLLVAGRCASMTHEGQSAARASGGCFAMGQAAGTAAALALAGSTSADLAGTDPAALRNALVADGAWLG